MTTKARTSGWLAACTRAAGVSRLAAAFCLAFLACSLVSLHGADKPIRLKLGTLAPTGSSSHKALQAMGEKWRKLSNGSVQLIIFPGGTQGSEADMVGLMQTGNLDAALVTTAGLSEIDPGALAFEVMPLFFRSLDELDYLTVALRPKLEAGMLAKGYVTLFWGDSGWSRFFSKTPVIHPDDLRKLKVYTWSGNVDQAAVWRAAGFTPVALETSGIAQGLLSGTISAVPTIPIFALASQLDAQAKHMLEINWGPLVGAAVVQKKSWDRIPSQFRDDLLKVATETGRQITAAGRTESDQAVAAMIKRGLQVHKVTPEIEAEWRAVVENVQDKIRGHVVPADAFDEAHRLLKEYRAQQDTGRK